MAGATDVVVKFLADVSNVSDGVDKIEKTTGRMQKWSKRVAGLIGTAFAVKEVGDFISAAEEANVANARLEQTLKNAGDATGQWATHAEDLANTLMNQTGIDDEIIKGAQGILATFHNVGGQVGETSGAFDRATQAALDLSKAGFGDVDSAAKMLGKALEDPSKGLTALSKAGVTFTADQKKLIKAMVASGDQAGAMNEILKIVEGQVGGVAEKTATAGDKMKVAWGETKEALGQALLPVLEKLAPKVQQLAKYVQENAHWLVPTAVAVAALVIGLKAWIGAQTLLNGLLATFGIELAVPAALIFAIAIAIAAAYVAVALLYAKWDEVWSYIGDLPAYAKVGLAILALTNPVTLLILAIATLAVYWEDIWNVISTVLKWVWNNVLLPIFGFIGQALSFVADWLRALAMTWSVVWGVISTVAKFVWDNILEPVIHDIGLALSWLNDKFFQYLVPALAPLLSLALAFKWVWEQIDQYVGWIIDRIHDLTNALSASLGPLQGFLGSGGSGSDLLNAARGSTSGGNFRIPRFGAGGIVTRPTLAMLGEAGPEAVVPLSGSSRGGNIVINVHTTGLGADAPSIQSAVVQALRQYTTRNGPLPAAITGA